MYRERVRSLIGRGLHKLLVRFGSFDLDVVYRRDLGKPLRPFTARIPVSIAEADESDMEEIARPSPYHHPEVLRARRRAGNKCFVARIEGAIVGFNWIALGPVEDGYYRVALRPGDVYCLDAGTAEAYRGNGIHTELLYRMLLFAQEAGYRRAYTRVSAMNMSSWKTHLRLGWEEAGSTFAFRPYKAASGAGRYFGPAVYPLVPMREDAPY